MSRAEILVCALWEERCELLPSERRTCARCRRAVAMDPKNVAIVAQRRMEIQCFDCSKRELRQQFARGEFRGLVGGERISVPQDFVAAVFAQIKRRAG